MELSKGQIQKIDQFLEAIGIEYLDIRLEMVDHIASEMEENIKDIDAFFQDQKLQSPYLKYLLSKQKELNELYRKQLKTKFWTNFSVILRQFGKQLLDIKNILMITAIIFLIYFLKIQYTKPIIISLFLGTIGIFLYVSLSNKILNKDLGKLKITQSYIALLGVISNVYILFPMTNIIIPETRFEPFKIYSHLFFFCLSFLLFKTYSVHEKEIKQQYKLLINK